MKWKASEITNLTDARYFAAWGVSYMGFRLKGNGGEGLTAAEFLSIKEWVEGPEIIAEVEDLDPDLISALVRDLDLTHIQVSANVDVQSVRFEEVNIWQVYPITNKIDDLLPLDYVTELADHYILRADQVPSQAVIDKMNSKGEVWLDIAEVGIERMKDLYAKYPELGICLRGGAEEKIGYKSFEDLDAIFEAFE